MKDVKEMPEVEFQKEALLKAGKLATAARNVLTSSVINLGENAKALDKVLSEYNDFIIARVGGGYLLG